jgi:hypothetical protein
LFSVITPAERFNDQREMDKGAEHHIDLRVCVTLASSVGVTTSSLRAARGNSSDGDDLVTDSAASPQAF